MLVVDDEIQIAKCLRRLLMREGFDVEMAFGAHQALDVLERFRPDLVVSDFRMPAMNGAELLAEVRRRLPLTVRVIASGYADLAPVMAGVEVGEICRCFKKPWDDRELVTELRGLLDGGEPVP